MSWVYSSHFTWPRYSKVTSYQCNLQTDSDSLPRKCTNSPFTDRQHKHIVTGDQRIIKSNALRKSLTKWPKYREVRPINLERSKSCTLEGLGNCILSLCCKNGADKYLFLESTNNVMIVDERINNLINK